MYGTVARIKVKAGAEAQIEALGREYAAMDVPGYVGQYVYKADAGGNEYWMAVAFADKESYFANANSPEQAKRYEEFRALLAEDPEWHDGEIVFPTS